jgi:hypothetical protein
VPEPFELDVDVLDLRVGAVEHVALPFAEQRRDAVPGLFLRQPV